MDQSGRCGVLTIPTRAGHRAVTSSGRESPTGARNTAPLLLPPASLGCE